MKRLASHFLFLSPDRIYKKQVVEINQREFIRFFPLEEEIESVLWMPGILFLTSQTIGFYEIRNALKKATGENLLTFLSNYSSPVVPGDVVSVYLITSVDFSSFAILTESCIEEL